MVRTTGLCKGGTKKLVSMYKNKLMAAYYRASFSGVNEKENKSVMLILIFIA
jgi:hypothetical protein